VLWDIHNKLRFFEKVLWADEVLPFGTTGGVVRGAGLAIKPLNARAGLNNKRRFWKKLLWGRKGRPFGTAGGVVRGAGLAIKPLNARAFRAATVRARPAPGEHPDFGCAQRTSPAGGSSA